MATRDAVLVDTNVVSYLIKNHSLATAYLPHLHGTHALVAFVTVGELYLWVELSGWGTRRRRGFEESLASYTVCRYTAGIARAYARIVAARRRAGRPISANDAWIAACAVEYGIPLVTHNAGDFEGIEGLEVISEGA